MQITFKDILTTYWAQIVLLMAALGFIIKRILDLQIKKIDVKQSLFQQNRNAAIMRFMDTYIELQGLYRQILCQTFDFNMNNCIPLISILSFYLIPWNKPVTPTC